MLSRGSLAFVNLISGCTYLVAMAGPNHGALGSTFKLVRILQALSLLAIIGMAANFISQMIQHNNAPSEVLVGTLSVVSPSKYGLDRHV